MNVLLIDDHEIVWDGTHRLLKRLVAELQPQAEFGFRAVRDVATACALPDPRFDLILLDYHLPGVSGLAALQAVKAHFESTPVCLQSAESGPQRVREVIEAGAAGFVPKSYRLDEIEAALRVVLRHRVYLPAEFLLSHEATRAPAAADANGAALAREDLSQFLRAELSPRQRQVLALAHVLLAVLLPVARARLTTLRHPILNRCEFNGFIHLALPSWPRSAKPQTCGR